MIGLPKRRESRGLPTLPLGRMALVVLGSLSIVQTGCVASGQVTTGDVAIEQQYKMIWHRDILQVRQAAVPLAASGASPGVCNVGGSKQACYETSEKVATDLQTLLDDLRAITVPP